jgi:hypothetical protein
MEYYKRGGATMLALSIEDKLCWNRPMVNVIPIEEYSDFKKQLICQRFEVDSIEELKVGSFVENDDERTTIVEVDV